MKGIQGIFKKRFTNNNSTATSLPSSAHIPNAEQVVDSRSQTRKNPHMQSDIYLQLQTKDFIISALKEHIQAIEQSSPIEKQEKVFQDLMRVNTDLKDLHQQVLQACRASNTVQDLSNYHPHIPQIESQPRIKTENLQFDVKNSVQQLTLVKQQNRNLLLINDSMETEIQAIRKVLIDKTLEIQELNEDLAQLNSRLKAKTYECSIYTGRGSVSIGAIEYDEREVHDLKSRLKSIDQENEELSQRNAILNKQYDQMKVKMDKAQMNNTKLRQKLINLRQRPDNPKEEMQRIKRQLSNISEPSSPFPDGGQSFFWKQHYSDAIYQFKAQLEKLYQLLIQEISSINETSNAKEPLGLCKVEHEMNRIIMEVSDKMQESVAKKEFDAFSTEMKKNTIMRKKTFSERVEYCSAKNILRKASLRQQFMFQ